MRKVFLEMERLRNPYSGLGQFCSHLGTELAKQVNKEELDLYVYSPYNQSFENKNQLKNIVVSRWHRLFPIRGKYDVWHCMHQNSKFLPFDKNTRLILTIHDLNFLERQDYSKSRKQTKLNSLQKKINRCSAITYISNFTQNTVHEHLQLPSTLVEKVIYNGNNTQGFEARFEEIQPFVTKYPAFDFVFSIGIIQPKKNFHVLLPILQKNKKLHWLIAGDNSGDYAWFIQQEAQNLGVENQVHFLGKIQESEKIWLFQHCQAFLFPSLSEGFGLPVVEAMSFGKPVFLSRLTSLPEIGAKEAYYFEDFSPETITRTFDLGMQDFQKDTTKSIRLQQRATEFSWEAAAKSYLDLYKSI